MWCRISRSDEDVIDEASFAKRRSITLLPVKLDDIEPPLGFGNLQTISLVGWNGNSESPQIRAKRGLRVLKATSNRVRVRLLRNLTGLPG